MITPNVIRIKILIPSVGGEQEIALAVHFALPKARTVMQVEWKTRPSM